MNDSKIAKALDGLNIDSGHNVYIPVSAQTTPTQLFVSAHVYNSDADDIYNGLSELFMHSEIFFVFDAGNNVVKMRMVSGEYVETNLNGTATVWPFTVETGTDESGNSYVFIAIEPAIS